MTGSQLICATAVLTTINVGLMIYIIRLARRSRAMIAILRGSPLPETIERAAAAMVTAINPDPRRPGSFRWNVMEGMLNMSEADKDRFRRMAAMALAEAFRR